MEGMLMYGLVLLALPVGGWLFFAIRNHRKTEKPKPTPWADGTQVAAEVRRMRGDE